MKKAKNEYYETLGLYLLAATLFVVGIALGILLKSFLPTNPSPYKQTREGGYEYINPLIDFETVQSAGNRELTELEHRLEEYIEKTDSGVSHISVYYKDLNSGGWIGIHEDEKFSPASLLKVPIMIAVYKMAQDDPNLLNMKLVFNSQETLKQNILPENSLTTGQEYTIEELIVQLIKYSDNTVLVDILEFLPGTEEERIFTELGITNPYKETEINIMTVKEYASFFRILYNASYLDKDMSTKALKLLSETSYEYGISGSVPNDIKVAHKFGEREIKEEENNFQLHDCGIIYHPQKPYLLCIMTRGDSFEILQPTISKISSIVYDIVNE